MKWGLFDNIFVFVMIINKNQDQTFIFNLYYEVDFKPN